MLTFFGFMHGEAVGFAVTPSVALAYVMVAAFLYACARLEWAGRGASRQPLRPRAAGGMSRCADRDAWIDAASAVVGLAHRRGHRPGVARFLALARRDGGACSRRSPLDDGGARRSRRSTACPAPGATRRMSRRARGRRSALGERRPRSPPRSRPAR